jgi:adenine-specific DNA-methyltransferase
VALATDPGDLILDPTLGSGTTAVVAERLGRRWVGVDVSRVAINVSRRRLLSSVFPHYVMKGKHPWEGLALETVSRLQMSDIADDREAETVELRDRPITDSNAVRVVGPFEVLTLGRYSIEDWRGYLVGGEGDDSEKLENYVGVICRLYRPHAEVGGAGGFVHALSESGSDRIGISVGPLTGRVTARQVLEAATEAIEHEVEEIHVLGWAFEANVGEQKSAVEKDGRVRVQLIMIRPDALADGLKITQPELLFSPLALPEIEITAAGQDKVEVTLAGVGLFNRKTRFTAYHPADDGYIAAWYLDEDYDGDCFVDCQMFFEFKKAPDLKAAAGVDVNADEFRLAFTSEPFEPGEYRRIAVKVVDVYGNESTVVREL